MSDPQIPPPPRKRKSRWAHPDDDGDDDQQQLPSNTPISTLTPSSSLANLNDKLVENALLVSSKWPGSGNDVKIDPNNPSITHLRWSIANIALESRVQHDIGPSQLTLVNPKPSTFMLPQKIDASLDHQSRTHVAVLHNQIEDLQARIQNYQYETSRIPSRERSPSPPPRYDIHGNRLNTREQRFKELLNKTRNSLITQLLQIIPTYEADGYRPDRPFRDVPIPVDEYPSYNFSGLIIGPRGVTHQEMESSFRCKISIRGKLPNEVKTRKNQWSNDPPHVHIEGDDEEMVVACAEKLTSLINMSTIADVDNDHKSRQLMELSRYNGTLTDVKEKESRLKKMVEKQRENSSYKGPTVSCENCGLNHLTEDCTLVGELADFEKYQETLMTGYDLFEKVDNNNNNTDSSNYYLNTNNMNKPTRPRRNDYNNDKRADQYVSLTPDTIDLSSSSSSSLVQPPHTDFSSPSNHIMNPNMNQTGRIPLGTLQQSPQGLIVMTQFGPMLLDSLNPPALLDLANSVLQLTGPNSPLLRELTLRGINPANLQELANRFQQLQQQQQLQQPNYNNQSFPVPPPTTHQPQSLPPPPQAQPQSTQPTSKSDFQPPPPPGVVKPASSSDNFLPPPPPGTNNNNNNSSSHNNHINNSTAQNNTSHQNNQYQSPQQPQPQQQQLRSAVPSPQETQDIYNKEYQKFWTQYQNTHGKSPTNDDWYQEWSIILPKIQSGTYGQSQSIAPPPPPFSSTIDRSTPIDLSTKRATAAINVSAANNNSAFSDYMKAIE
jgi:hypothetical protein